MAKQLGRSIFAALILVCAVFPAVAENAKAPHPKMVEDIDGSLVQNEYIVISPNGSITRALCPYTCEMRGLPPEHCKTWPSKSNPTECYVQDTRLPSTAMENEQTK